MIYVFDNGGDLADEHRLYFIEASIEDWNNITKLFKAANIWPDAFLVFSTPTVEWHKGKPTQLGTMIEPRECFKITYKPNKTEYIIIDNVFNALTTSIVNKLLLYWELEYKNLQVYIDAFKAECKKRKLIE